MASDLSEVADMRRAVRGFFGRRVASADDAEDLTQETFARALAHWADLRDAGARPAWLFTIAHNVLRDHYRGAQRDARPAGEPLPELAEPAAAPEPGLRAAIRAGLAALPVGQRHVLLLRLFEDLSFADIARRLGIPEATAYTRAYYGLRRLRAAVALHLQKEVEASAEA